MLFSSVQDFKQERGFGEEHRFHSFRHTLYTQLKNLECPEFVAFDITGHKIPTIGYGGYAGSTNIDVMRRHLERVKY